jgi:hypothetical protein
MADDDASVSDAARRRTRGSRRLVSSIDVFHFAPRREDETLINGSRSTRRKRFFNTPTTMSMCFSIAVAVTFMAATMTPGVDGQAQRIALYSNPDGKGSAVLLTDSCEDLGDRSKPGCTGIPAGTSFDNKAQSARIDGL